ncbi:MAG: CPBP family intramembrane glutamic endopeptidase [Pseudomonadota bacterium]
MIDQTWIPALTKLAIPAAGILVMLMIAHYRQFSLREDFGFRGFNISTAAIFLVLWILLIIVEEVISGVFNLAQARHWPALPLSVVLIRIMAIGVIGPVSEEMAWRGIFFSWINKKLGAAAAIILPSLIWAPLHLQYDSSTQIILIIDGIFLGLVRYKTQSIWPPIILHISGNLFSIYQSLA